MTLSPLMVVILLVVGPVLSLPFLYAARRRPNLRESVSLGAGFLNLFLVVFAVSSYLKASAPEFQFLDLLPGVPLAFRLDGLGSVLLLTTGLLWPLATIYSAGYLRGSKESQQTRFFSFFALAVAATNSVALSSNLLTLYLFYELLSLSTYPLVVHAQDEESKRAGRRYLAFIVGGSVGIALPALLAVYTITGSLDFGAPGRVFLEHDWAAALLTAAFLFGFSKAAVMPMHGWLPAAMVAPTPVSALLHAVAVVKVGVFSVIRAVTEVLGPKFLIAHHTDHMITTFCALTVLVSAALMMSQDSLKRCLAFSTIGQLSMILLGVSLLNEDGVTGGVVHIFMHGFGKITLFFCAGAIAVTAHKKSISEFDGLAHVMPWTFAAFTVGCLSIVGLPPTGGLLSKWLLVSGCLKKGMPVIAGMVLLSSLFKAAAFFSILFRAYLKPCPPESSPPNGEAGLLMRLPLLITAAGSVVLFFFPNTVLRLAESFAHTVLDQAGL